MSDTIISVEKLSKSYRLGVIGTGTFKGDIQRWWARMHGLPDPHIKFGEADHGNRDGEMVWALRDINFTVQRGEALGIIGRNGAGKSTLLKILSQVTAPTSGVVKAKGQVASLLEVGTGFHPELTGRENVYLNGAILGMHRSEVSRKLDEIVDFSGIETYIDTPVKRYSSGMYVRLAFAVAAHLEPDILVVDEVLAVGDAEFQKKCLGKMGDVTKEGRTVLFVSHNMDLIRNICDRTILLAEGRIIIDGQTSDVISHYLSLASQAAQDGKIVWGLDEAPGTESFKLRSLRLFGSDSTKSQTVFDAEWPINVEIIYQIFEPMHGHRLILHVVNQDGMTLFASTDQNLRGADTLPPGSYRVQCTIPPRLLKRGNYHVKVTGGIPNVGQFLKGEEILEFTVDLGSAHGSYIMRNWPGVIAPQLDWTRDERVDYE